MYVSEITRFLEEMKEKNPDLESEQRRGRSIWWDKPPLNPTEAARKRAATVQQSAYVYQTQVKG